jgi:uncharacterized RmlC-like cupin family protein
MAIYTFRPETVRDAPLVMRYANLPSDALAKSHAHQVLALYPRFGAVQIWDGERLVDSIVRQPALDDCLA